MRHYVVLCGKWGWGVGVVGVVLVAASRPKYNYVVVTGVGLLVGFVGLQQRWSVRLRTCLILGQLHYDSYLSFNT